MLHIEQKKIILLVISALLVFLNSHLFAQVGVGTASPVDAELMFGNIGTVHAFLLKLLLSGK